MKTKTSNKKHLITYIILVAVPLFFNTVAMLFLPDKIPAHFGINGEVDRFGSKFELFIIPAFSLIFGVIMFFSAKISSEEETSTKNNQKIVLITGECCLGLFIIINCYWLYIAFTNAANFYSTKIEIGNILCLLMGIMMIILGNIMPKAKRNSIVGFRFPWTMKSDEIWKKSQHFAGIASIICGIFLIVSSFFVHNISAIFLIIGSDLIMTVICLVYAYKLSHCSDTNI